MRIKAFFGLMAGIAALDVMAADPVVLDWGAIDTATPEQQTLSRDLRTAQAAMAQRKGAEAPAPWLVQFNGVVREEWKAALLKAGAVIQGYIPENAFLIEATPAALATIAAMPEVYWVGEYLPEYKRSRPVRAALAKGLAGTREMNVLVFDRAAAEQVAANIAALPDCAVIRAETMTDRGLVRAALTAAGVETVSGWSAVEWIEPYVPRKLCNNIAVRGNKMNVTNAWNILGLSGAGQTIAICDTGLDSGNTSTIHKDFSNRVVWAQALGRVGDWSDTDGHGTHVAGSVLGSGLLSTGLYRGVAYAASLVFQSVLDSEGGLGGLPADLNVLYRAAYTNGARIHSDSWGAAVAGEYDTDARNTDMFIWSNKNMLVVFAAGNEGIDANRDGVVDPGSVDAPGTAKNCLTIGASENYRLTGGYSTYRYGIELWTNDYPVDPIKSDYPSRPDTNQGIVAFSSRGPCLDGRIKPEIVAPGTDIISTRSRATTDNGWGLVSGSTNYMYMGGTSMATPLMSGASGLTRQWLISSQGITNPSAALIKALLINGARDMAPGQYGTGATQEIPYTRPNNVQGYGHVDLYGTLTVKTGQFLDLYDTNTLTTGQTNSFLMVISSANPGTAVVTMAYSDYFAAAGAGKKLVNDLDLTIRKPSGTILYANGRTSVDATNNMEMIAFNPDETGTYTIRVAGRTVPSGGSQAYALVVRGFEQATDDLGVVPAGDFLPVGPQGGPFAPTSAVYTVTNSGVASLTWQARKAAGLTWLTLSKTNGTLAAGASDTLVWMVNVTANTLAAGEYQGLVTFTNLTAGTAQTRSATLTARPASQFRWNSIASPQEVDAPFAATITALDSAGATVTAFTASAALNGQVATTGTVGAGTGAWSFPLGTYYHDARAQVIYLQSELGAATTLNGLALNISSNSGQTLNNWTIRMKHTTMSAHAPASWEGPASGWTTVYQNTATGSATGWVWFAFTTPFQYNGTSNLLVDFSFNNDSYTSYGYVHSSTGAAGRAVVALSDSAAGDPLDWTGTSNPTPLATNRFPNIRLLTSAAVSITPTNTGAFTAGTWFGTVTVHEACASMTLRATATNGAAGDSSPFAVTASATSTPLVTTAAISNITPTAAQGGGTVTSEGGAAVTRRGLCWGTSAAPTTNDFRFDGGTGAGGFSGNLTSLTPGQLYYARAFAVNAYGVAYGGEAQFSAACFTNAPALASASGVSETQFTANWAAVGGATGYRLDVSTNAAFGAGGGGGGGQSMLASNAATSTTPPEGWIYDISGSSSSYLILGYATNYVVSAAFSTVGFTSLTVDFQARTYGGTAADTTNVTISISSDNGTNWTVVGVVARGVNTMAAMPTLTNTANLGGSQTRIRWQALGAAANKGVGIQALLVNGWSGGSGAPSYVPSYSNRAVAGTSAAVTGLTGGVTYYVRVRAEAAAGCVSASSATQSVVTGGGQYIIVASAGAHGSISPAGNVGVSPGASQSFTATADQHYRIADIQTNTASIGVAFNNASTNYVFAWNNIQATGTIAATFTDITTTNAPVPVPETYLADNYPGSNYAAVVLSDTDGDGMTTWQEYVAGTSPTNADSRLAAEPWAGAANNQNVIRWLGSDQVGRKYSLYWGTNLFSPLDVLVTNIPSAYPELNQYTNPAPAGGAPAFYRIRVDR